jgi:hypothetical protein
MMTSLRMPRATLEILFATALGAVTVACTDVRGSDAKDSLSGGSESATESGSADDDDSAPQPDDDGVESADESSSSEGTVFDLGSMPDIDMPPLLGCEKVDFLFVIDNSESMVDNQANLAANFPAFIDGIQATLADVDEYQVGVVTSDSYAFNSPPCDELGGLVVRTGGDDSSSTVCGPYAAGDNFMTEADDLATEFECAARVGSEGNGIEFPMNAVEVAVRKDLGEPGECNEGFIRDDALLVLVIITDEWDGPGDPEIFGSTGDAASWYETVVDAKGGFAQNVVVLSLVHFGECPPTDGGSLSGDIEPFTTMFGGNGFLGCIDSDYGDLFTQATAIIDGACDGFVPPG